MTCHGANVAGIAGQRGDFRITLGDGGTVLAETVVLAIGLQGNIRKFGVPGEDLANVQHQLDDPDEYADETIVVVGGGDAGIENALALALTRQNRVFVINREEEFNRCKEGNLSLLMAAIGEGEVSVLPGLADHEDARFTLGAGAFFGEIGLISGRRRNASVVAGPGCVLIETPRRSMLKLIASVESVRRLLDQESLKRAVHTFLGMNLSGTELHFLAQGAPRSTPWRTNA